MNTLLIDALACRNRRRFPVWLMRQAGRILPSYRRMREKHGLHDLFHHPESIARITCLPLEELEVDAAILFSDILNIVEMFGMHFSFPENQGPLVIPPIITTKDIEEIQIKDAEETFPYLKKAIPLIKKEITVPLIGFCGGPLTVATYLLAGGRENLNEWMQKEPQGLHLLLKKLTQASKSYLDMQIKAGVDVLQIFDSWAGQLSQDQFRLFALPYLNELVEFIQERNVPSIIFARGSSLFSEDLCSINPTAISFDWNKDIDQLRNMVPSEIAVQGNLNPEFLMSSFSTVRKETKKMLKKMRGEKGYIVNLGHGVLPNTPLHNVKCFIDTVKEYS